MDNLEIPGSREELESNNDEMDAMQGLEEISLSTENDDETTEDETEDIEVDVFVRCNFDVETAVNGEEDLCKIDFKEVSLQDAMRYHFPDVGVAYKFYNWYASVHGFAARKSKFFRNKDGKIVQQTFFCYRQGHREEKYCNRPNRKREPKPHTKCGCEAKCKVHIDMNSGRWYIKYLNDSYNHSLIDNKFMGMLPSHRRMSEYDIFQMNKMRRIGIGTSHIYGFLASQAGGFERIRFRKRDMYNEQERQKRSLFSDAHDALVFLEGMRSSDNMMFCRHTKDEDGRLEHLFWCDGIGQRDYSVFGDVLAFDATYRKNKYLSPFVVFSGVNHHNQSIVFASAVVGNETEQTYVWLLEQFLEAMGGKIPTSVITDGDVAMRNAIKRVFPSAHHRLCAWHLLRNAASNVKNPKFVGRFKQCMLGDYDVGEFKRKWSKMVADFALEENKWVREMYDKRKMWATAHIRGQFFAGFRTTSRCEGLHSEFGKYVNCQNNLVEFLHHFFRWVNYKRYREVEADFCSLHGEPVIQTQLQGIERSATDVYTREVFLLFRPVLQRACTCMVIDCRQTTSSFIYTVSKYGRQGSEWHVSFSQSSLQFRCSCERLESLGIPCEHLVSVMVYLHIMQLPDCLVLRRWTKAAKDLIGVLNDNVSFSRDPTLISQYVGIVERCKRMATAAIECGRPQYIRSTIDLVSAQTQMLEAVVSSGNSATPTIDGNVRNPARARSKGCGGESSSAQATGTRNIRKAHTCGICGEEGHNRKSCHLRSHVNDMAETQVGSNAEVDDNEDLDEDCDYANIDTNVE